MVRREIAPIQKTMQDVQFFERGKSAAEANNYRWDDLKLFLIAAEAGSLRAAARIAGCSLNTIRNRLEQLEHDLGIVLGKRTADGLVLTPEGFELASIARAMRSTGATIERLRRGREQERGGRISFAVTEGLGTFWLMPRLVEFQADNPHLTIDLSCDMRPVDVLFRDTDLAIQLDMPDHPDLVVTRVGTLHLMPFASPAYLAKHGTPHSIQEALSHKLVLQVSDQISHELMPLFFGTQAMPGLVGIRTNTSSAHYWAIARGAGIGLLPTYARAMTRRVVPIDMELKLRRDILLVYHPDSRRSQVVQKAIEWIRHSFDPIRFPWFAEQFVHPNELETRLNDSEVVNLFDDLQDIG
jgi:DNA-binding transcriptional LysR family regulator